VDVITLAAPQLLPNYDSHDYSCYVKVAPRLSKLFEIAKQQAIGKNVVKNFLSVISDKSFSEEPKYKYLIVEFLNSSSI